MPTLLSVTLSTLYSLLLSSLSLLLLLPFTQIYVDALQKLLKHVPRLPGQFLPEVISLLSIKQSFPLLPNQVSLLASLQVSCVLFTVVWYKSFLSL